MFQRCSLTGTGRWKEIFFRDRKLEKTVRQTRNQDAAHAHKHVTVIIAVMIVIVIIVITITAFGLLLQPLLERKDESLS